MAQKKKRNGGNNSGRGQVSSRTMKTIGLNPAFASSTGTGQRNPTMNNRRKANTNTAAYTGYNGAGFGSGASAAAGLGGRSNPGSNDRRRASSRNNTGNIPSAGAAAGKTRKSGGG